MAERTDRATDTEEADKLPFTAHLEELRSRLIKCILALLAGFGACYGYSNYLLEFIARPVNAAMPEGGSLAVIKVTEGFMTHLQLSLLAGFFLSSPIWFYQIYRFVAPGLYPKERRYIWPFVLAASAFFILGASFAYFVVLPFGLQFLLNYSSPAAQELTVATTTSISLEAYMSFFTRLTLAFGLVFEMPVVVFFLARMGLIHYTTLSRKRGIATVVIFIVAAILTPPDVLTQLLMAFPLLVLYEISIIVARVFGTKELEEDEEEQ